MFIFRCASIASTNPGKSVRKSIILTDFHSVSVCEPSQGVEMTWWPTKKFGLHGAGRGRHGGGNGGRHEGRQGGRHGGRHKGRQKKIGQHGVGYGTHLLDFASLLGGGSP